MRIATLGIAVALPALVAAGCATRSQVDEHWGEAYREAREAQLAYPDEWVTDVAPRGLDAFTAELVAERYYRGQRVQQSRQAPSVIIGEIGEMR